MILQELLKLCDCEEIARIWKKKVFPVREYSETEIADVIDKFRTMLCKAYPDTSDAILVAHRCWKNKDICLKVVLYRKKELDVAISNIEKKDVIIPVGCFCDALRKEYYSQILQSVSGILPTSYQYSNLSWETVIGAEVETLSVKKYGLNNFVADVLWKMAASGLVKEDAQHARIILRYTEKEKLAENVKNVCSRILDMKEIGAVQKREIPTSK